MGRAPARASSARRLGEGAPGWSRTGRPRASSLGRAPASRHRAGTRLPKASSRAMSAREPAVPAGAPRRFRRGAARPLDGKVRRVGKEPHERGLTVVESPGRSRRPGDRAIEKRRPRSYAAPSAGWKRPATHEPDRHQHVSVPLAARSTARPPEIARSRWWFPRASGSASPAPSATARRPLSSVTGFTPFRSASHRSPNGWRARVSVTSMRSAGPIRRPESPRAESLLRSATSRSRGPAPHSARTPAPPRPRSRESRTDEWSISRRELQDECGPPGGPAPEPGPEDADSFGVLGALSGDAPPVGPSASAPEITSSWATAKPTS